MKLIKLILMILTIILTSSAFAQQLGLKAGMNISTIEGDIEIGLKSRTGYHIGIYRTKVLSENFTLQTGILYSTKGAKFSYFDSYDDGNGLVFSEEMEMTWQSHYIDIPFSFNYHLEPDLFITMVPTFSVST